MDTHDTDFEMRQAVVLISRSIRVAAPPMLFVVLVALSAGCERSESLAPGARQPSHAWYVSATAAAGGDGSAQAPFNTLAAVEQSSAAGDTIIVLPSPIDSAALDGGIALKVRQRLIGAGPAVASAAPLGSAPKITNSSSARNSGDAVVLADGAEVANLVIVNSYRGGIYGLNVIGVNLHDNNVSGQNTSCTEGFFIPPFTAPTMFPGVAAPIASGLRNGWAGIMVDASRVAGALSIHGNFVHDASCGDGIDLRLSGTSVIQADLTHNVVENLAQGATFQSVLAMGMQTADQARLVANLDYNRQTNIGSANADSEGVFAQLTGPSELIANVDHNTFSNGIGGFSANGMEFVILGGNGSHGDMRISNSSFTDVTGDVFEEGNLGTDASMNLVLDNVIAARSNGMGNTTVLPFNNGDCLFAGMGGSGNTVTLSVRNSQLTDCVNNGLTLGSNPIPMGASNNVLSFDVQNSKITGNRNYNLRVLNLGALEHLSGKVENTDLRSSQGTNIAFDQQGSTTQSILDFGGGALGSAGGNCIFGGGSSDATVSGFAVLAQHNWWGNAAGPAAGRATVSNGGRLDIAPVLSAPPMACQ
jgi:hypothetical protein